MGFVWFLFWCCPLLSEDCFLKLGLSGTSSENSQVGCDLGNRTGRGCRFDANESVPWELIPEVLKCSIREIRHHQNTFSNRTLEYLKHNFPRDRLILRQTENPWPFYSQDLNPLTILWQGTWKTKFVKIILRQERTASSEEKSDKFQKKCSIELSTILMFELLLCCHTAAQCMEPT